MDFYQNHIESDLVSLLHEVQDTERRIANNFIG